MTPKVFLTTAIAGAALVVAVPALADTPGDQGPATVRVSPDRADRAAAARQSGRPTPPVRKRGRRSTRSQ